jgi:threonine aldolase
MANLICLLVHCARGEEAIMGDMAHTFLFEAGGSAAVGGIHPHTVPNQLDGTLALDDLEAAVRPAGNEHYPRTRLVCLENTHNRRSGAVLTPDYMSQVRDLADRHGLAVHLDGARLFNAAIALNVPVAELAQHADSVSFCLSKGLSAPVGSMVCGSAEFAREARRKRKLLGGGMRQAGVLAAAGIVALDTMVERMAEDHANAKRLAKGLASLPGIILDVERIQTNIVIFELAPGRLSPAEMVARLDAHGVKMGAIGGRRFRAVTHYGIQAAEIDAALAAVADILKESG